MHSPAMSPFLMLGGAWLSGTSVALLVLLLSDRSPGRFVRASGVLTLSSLLFLTGLAAAWDTSHARPRTVTIDPHPSVREHASPQRLQGPDQAPQRLAAVR